VAYSPDGRRIVSSRADTLKVWDAQTGQELLTLKGHTGRVRSVAYSPDGTRIVSAGGEVKVWDAQTGQELLTLKGVWYPVAYSPDGRHIVSGSKDEMLKVWDATTGQPLRTLKGHTQTVTSVAYSPDGRRIVSGSGEAFFSPTPGEVKVWDAQTGQELLTLKGHTRNVTSVAYSPDGRRIVSASGDRTLQVWDATTGQHLLTLKGHTDNVSSVAYSSDGKRIVSSSWDKTVKVWDAATGQEVLSLKGHTSRVSSVAYSPDSERIVSGSWDTLKVWGGATSQDLLTLKGHSHLVMFVAYSPDGTRIVSGSWDNTLKVWDATMGQHLLTLTGHTQGVRSVAYSPDGKRIVSASDDKTVKVWDAGTGQVQLTLEGHTNVEGGIRVLRDTGSAVFSPDGKRIASGGDDGALKVWDAQTGQNLLTRKGHIGGVISVAYSPDGKHIVSGGGGYDSNGRGIPGEVKVWDAHTGQNLLTLKGHTNGVSSVAYSPDGRRVFACDVRGKVLAWNAVTGMLLRDTPATIPDGRLVAVHGNQRAYADGWLVRIERVFTQQEQQRRALHEDRIQRILQARASRAFHTAEADNAQMRKQTFACVFHLDRLLPLLPGERANLLKRRAAVLTAALKKAPRDTWAIRALARQAVADPATIPQRETLLSLRAALARQQDAPNDRLYGALLLRTGSPREAVLILRAARNKRDRDAAPVEELLLALAHLRLKQPAEARKYLQTAVAWMQRGSEPVRAASLAGLAARSPLTALAGLVVTPPDPRLEPLDHQTAHELTALGAEVERALAKQKP
jgi:WD40 repeat protein